MGPKLFKDSWTIESIMKQQAINLSTRQENQQKNLFNISWWHLENWTYPEHVREENLQGLDTPQQYNIAQVKFSALVQSWFLNVFLADLGTSLH